MNLPPPISEDQTPKSDERSKRRTDVVLVLVVIAFGFCLCFSFIAAILFPVFSQARIAAKRTQALGEMKQLAVATLIYVSENDDRFPNPMTRQTLLQLSDKSHKFVLLKQSGLTANEELNGRVVSTIEQPDLVWMAQFKNDNIGVNPLIAFVDGSVKFDGETE